MLNLPIPINKRLENLNNILIVGAGGGSDVLCGLPLYYTLLKQGKKPHLANLSHTDFKIINEHSDPIVLDSCLIGVNHIIKTPSKNFVEGYLSQFFKVATNQDVTVWMFNRTYVQELKRAFQRLIAHLNIEAIILVDGGVDSIMQGDEGKSILTNKFIDTTLLLSTLQEIKLVNNTFAVSCLDLSNNSQIVNKRISEISLYGGFYGGCIIANYMTSFDLMKSANEHLIANNNILKDVKLIVNKVDNTLEDDNENSFGIISYLFYNPEALVYKNILADKIKISQTYFDIVQIISPYIQNKV